MYNKMRFDRQFSHAENLLHHLQFAHTSKSLPILICKLEKGGNEPICQFNACRAQQWYTDVALGPSRRRRVRPCAMNSSLVGRNPCPEGQEARLDRVAKRGFDT